MPKVRKRFHKASLRVPINVAIVSELNSQELLQLYQDGRSDAATAIFDRYVERLLSLARSRIGPKLKRRIDAEDVVQSAYRSFFVHAKGDRYQLKKAGDLWRLLATVTLNKLRSQVEKQTAAKRSIDYEVSTDSAAIATKTPEPSAAEVVAIVEELHSVLNRLLPDERAVLAARLQGQSIPEIREVIGKSDRTIRRLLAEAREKIEARLLERDDSAVGPQPVAAEIEAPLLYTDYVIEQLVGSGGMGKVFRAREKRTGEKVAIKALHKVRQYDERAVAQFVQEAQILSSLIHPNIIGVQGIGRFPGGGYFLVMDFVDGFDLQTRLATGPLPLSEAIPIVRKVVEAVGHTHAGGIVHCDLKPANVLLDRQSNVFVTDFGFAYLVVGTQRTNTIGGTAGYLAPEVLSFRSKPTPAADFFSAGVFLLSLLGGSIPEDPLRVVEEQLPESAKRIIRRCLAEDPSKRYQSAHELSIDLEAIR